MLEDFPLEWPQRRCGLIGTKRTGIVMQQQHPFSEEAWSLLANGGMKFHQNRAVRGRRNGVALPSAWMMSLTRCNVSGMAISTGRPAQCSFSILVHPSENFCTQLWTAWHDRQCSPYMGSISLWISFASIFFCPQKTHNATLLYRGTCTQWHRHLVTAATSVKSCAYWSLCVTIKLDSAAI